MIFEFEAYLKKVVNKPSRETIRLTLICAVIVIMILSTIAAFARDSGQWDKIDPAIKKWFESLMMPDNPTTPCCGEADAYWADSYEVHGDQYVAIITDERPNEPLKRLPVPVGTKILIPKNKVKWDQSNPTGHGIVFMNAGQVVYCYLPPGGV